MATSEKYFRRLGLDLPVYVELQPADTAGDPAEAELAAEGWRWALCSSDLAPAGEYGHVHVDELEPITAELYERARAAGWPAREQLERPGPRVAHYLPGSPLVPAKFFSAELEAAAVAKLATGIEQRATGRPGLRWLHRRHPADDRG